MTLKSNNLGFLYAILLLVLFYAFPRFILICGIRFRNPRFILICGIRLRNPRFILKCGIRFRNPLTESSFRFRVLSQPDAEHQFMGCPTAIGQCKFHKIHTCVENCRHRLLLRDHSLFMTGGGGGGGGAPKNIGSEGRVQLFI